MEIDNFAKISPLVEIRQAKTGLYKTHSLRRIYNVFTRLVWTAWDKINRFDAAQYKPGGWNCACMRSLTNTLT